LGQIEEFKELVLGMGVPFGDSDEPSGDGWIAIGDGDAIDAMLMGMDARKAASLVAAYVGGTEKAEAVGYHRTLRLFEYATDCGETVWHTAKPLFCPCCGKGLDIG
jgi:hypothetical protein